MLLDPDPPDFPGLWASAWGQDAYGLWQAFVLEGVRQVMRWMPPGEFLMGSPPDEPGRRDSESLHPVTLTEGFWLAESACSQALWEAVMGRNPSRFAGNPQYPVEQVSWDDCAEFFDRANRLLSPGLVLRFPTEAQWEYACRAGTDTAFSTGPEISTDQANFDPGSGKGGQELDRQRPVDVLEFSPNAWGLYQMHGNVWEWCADWFDAYSDRAVTDPRGPAEGRDRVLRGGSWFDDRRGLRSAYRLAASPDGRFGGIGLRLAGG